jgi:hypothetical protein
LVVVLASASRRLVFRSTLFVFCGVRYALLRSSPPVPAGVSMRLSRQKAMQRQGTEGKNTARDVCTRCVSLIAGLASYLPAVAAPWQLQQLCYWGVCIRPGCHSPQYCPCGPGPARLAEHFSRLQERVKTILYLRLARHAASLGWTGPHNTQPQPESSNNFAESIWAHPTKRASTTTMMTETNIPFLVSFPLTFAGVAVASVSGGFFFLVCRKMGANEDNCQIVQHELKLEHSYRPSCQEHGFTPQAALAARRRVVFQWKIKGLYHGGHAKGVRL